MVEQTKLVKCPLCDGQGALAPRAIVDQFLKLELRLRLEARVAEIQEIADSEAKTPQGKVLNFQREVHNWNPATPIWRRSSKE